MLQGLRGTARLQGHGATPRAGKCDDLDRKLKELERLQKDEAVRRAQEMGPAAVKVVQQLHEVQASAKAGQAGAVEGASQQANRHHTSSLRLEDLERFQQDIKKKQEAIQAEGGASGAQTGSQQQRPQMAQDLNLVQARDISRMY